MQTIEEPLLTEHKTHKSNTKTQQLSFTFNLKTEPSGQTSKVLPGCSFLSVFHRKNTQRIHTKQQKPHLSQDGDEVPVQMHGFIQSQQDRLVCSADRSCTKNYFYVE